ncbi:MAG: hypothetical protein M3Y28_11600, partial [Armatimonadota bacterium]|nr:hypothetical protein [Armatimonadota bacterium]
RDNSRHVVREADVPFSDYDVVISIDPILDAAERPGTLMVYYMQEHWDSLYRVSLRRPERGYDLFLAHMMDGPARLRSLPQALSFPYLRSPDTVRSVFSAPPEEE